MPQDLRHALRLLAKAPSYTAVALTTLALGVAATASIFSVVNALLLKPLPYSEPERLVMLWRDLQARGGPKEEWLGPAHFFDWRSRAHTIESSAVYRTVTPSLTGAGDPEQLTGWAVSAEFFRMLGVRPALGRDFDAADDRPGAPGTVLLTHALWVRRFGSDPAIVGRAIALDREPATVIGVLPADFRNPFGVPEMFRPMQLDPAAARRNATLQMIARLRPAVSHAQAQAELTAVAAALAAEHPESDAGSTIRLTRLHDEVIGDVRGPALVLLGAVVLVLLITCANIANLQLARASTRAREMAVRCALGAGRTRIVRQLLTETAVLALMGATAGVLLSFWMLEGLLALAPGGTPRLAEVAIDRSVAAVGVVLALATSVVFGFAPALHSIRRDLVTALKEGKANTSVSSGMTARRVFVITELALALMLLVGAGLLLRTLVNMRGVDPGFAPQQVVTAVVTLPEAVYDDAVEVREFYRALLERLGTMPEVAAVGAVSVLPFSGADTDIAFNIEGRPDPTHPGDVPTAWYRIASPGYRAALGLRLEAGRFIEERDRDGSEPIAVINRTLARRYWPDEDPIGRRIRLGRQGGRTLTVVGVVGDVRHRSFREDPRGEVYLSYEQFTSRRQTLAIKAKNDALSMATTMRRHVAALDAALPLSRIATLEELIGGSLALPRILAWLMSAFAAAALVLAAIGIYGVVAYSVSLRTSEFGVRMALGARPADVLRLVMGQSVRLAAIGVGAGALAALGASRLMSALLFGVTPGDAPTFAVTAMLLVIVALAASYLPARRAVRIDPVDALRSQ